MVMTMDSIRNRMLFLHLFGWILAYVAFFYYSKFIGVQPPLHYIFAELATGLLVSLFVFYSFYSFLTPRLLSQKKWIRFLSLSLAVLFFAAVFRHLVRPNSYLAVDPIHVFSLDRLSLRAQLPARFILFSLLAVAATVLRITIGWFKSQTDKLELQNQILQMEKTILSNQLHPHFLFNILNNIYTLVRKKKESAPDAVMKLSKLLRNSVSHSNGLIPLQKEIDNLKDYLHLQKLRLSYPKAVKLETECPFPDKQVPGMLFIPIVENAFKHGTIDKEHPLSISVRCSKNVLRFDIRNAINQEDGEDGGNENGTGLSNLRRRLELSFPDSFQLKTLQSGSVFEVNLILTFNY